MYILYVIQVKESKERAMSVLSPYHSTVSQEFTHDSSSNAKQVTESGPLPFVSLLEFVSEVYQVRQTSSYPVEFLVTEYSPPAHILLS